jgi:hypothetical protein
MCTGLYHWLAVRSSEPGKFAIWLTVGHDCNRSGANKLSIDANSICCTNRTILVYSGVFTFLVDAYPTYAASALAANSFARSTFGGVFPLFGNQSKHPLLRFVCEFLSLHLRSSEKSSRSNSSGEWSTSTVVGSYSADLLLRTAMPVLHHIPGHCWWLKCSVQ